MKGSKVDLEQVNLRQLGEGRAIAQVDRALMSALVNVVDNSTDATQKRTVTLKITIKPEEDGENAILEYEVTSKLAGESPGVQYIDIKRGLFGSTGQTNIPGTVTRLVPPVASD